MKEWHRTVILLVLLLAAIGFLVWSHHNVNVNFVETV
jgi:hypothetical protein